MRKKVFAVLVIVGLLAALLPMPVGAQKAAKERGPLLPIAVDGTQRIKAMPVPAQPSPEEGAAIAAMGDTTESQCFGDDSTLTINIPSFDPEHPGDEDVVFWKESVGGSATLWVAWDFLTTDYGRTDVITCDQLAYLQGQMDGIVDTDVYYFGAYDQRPAGNPNIDVMIYNIVDESYLDPEFPFYIAGFFWSSINNLFSRNMIFIDSYDWENRLGPDAARPYLYEGVVAHELEHLIHNDHDANEDSWVDEGLADLAEYLNGFGHPDSHVVYYLAFHRTSLTVWGGGLEDYGAAYLFQLYLLENFGARDAGGAWLPDWTLNLVEQDLNGIEGVEAQTEDIFGNLFHDWILANYLDDTTLTGGGGYPLGYGEINFPFGGWSIQRSITDIYGSDNQGNLPISRYYGGYVSGTVQWPLGEVAPYGPMYLTYKGFEPLMNIYLRADNETGVAAHFGSWEVFSGGGNMLTDRMLTLLNPVSLASGGTLSFWTWYDLEEEWDYGFVEVSTDNGGTWAKIPGSITRHSVNPNHSTAWKNALGDATSSDVVITGNSGGWVPATFSLPAGDVLVRFSYYTDEAVNGAGWYIDALSIDGFSDGFEGGPGAWNLDGWLRTSGLVTNKWGLSYINPRYERGRLTSLVIGDTPVAVGDINNDSIPDQGVRTSLDTSRLNRDVVTLILYNQPPEGTPFNSGYRLFVEKGSAR